MPRRHVVPLVLACLWLILPLSPASARERQPNVIELQQAVRNNPQDPGANFKLGLKYKELGRPRQAAKYLKEAIRLKPDYAEAISELAKLKDTQGDYGDAAKGVQQVMKLQPKKTDELRDRLSNEYNKQGLALAKEGRFAEAEAAFKAAAKESPEAAGPLNNLGAAYFSANRYDEAAASFQEALRRDPNNAEARYNLGLTNLATGNKVGAYGEYLRLKDLDPDLAHELDVLTNPPRTLQSGPYPGSAPYYYYRK